MNDSPEQPSNGLSDYEIANRIRTGSRCRMCREPRRAGQLCWDHRDNLSRMLDPGYHGERDLERAASIPNLWAALDPKPGHGADNDRRPPGFRSTPPLNLDHVAMRDPRSVAYPVVDVWYELMPDGVTDDLFHPHYEDDNPPRSVEKVVSGLADMVWEELGYHGPQLTRPVEDLCGWLHAHLEHLIAREDASEVYRDVESLHAQLRPAAGDPKPRPVAECTGWVRDPVTREKVECGEPLFLPPPDPGVWSGPAKPPKSDPTKPVLRCRRCDRPYTHLMLLRQEIGAEVA